MKLLLILIIPIICLLSDSGLYHPLKPITHLNIYSKSDTSGVKKTVKTKGYQSRTTGIRFVRIETYMDSGYYPRSLYYNIRFAEILGANLSDVNDGKLAVKLINSEKKNIALVKEPRFYAAKTFKDRDEINILFSIPLDPEDAANKKYSYTLTLETESGRKLISMKGKIGFE